MPLLKQQLIEFLEKTNYKQKYWYGYTPNELVHKMMTDNAMQFMAKYYSKKYLEG